MIIVWTGMVRAASARSVFYRLVVVLKPEFCVQELEQGTSDLKVILLVIVVLWFFSSIELWLRVCLCAEKMCIILRHQATVCEVWILVIYHGNGSFSSNIIIDNYQSDVITIPLTLLMWDRMIGLLVFTPLLHAVEISDVSLSNWFPVEKSATLHN